MQLNSKKYKITSNGTVYQQGEIIEVVGKVYDGVEVSNGYKKMTVLQRFLYMHMREVM